MRSATHRLHPVSRDALAARWFPFFSSAFLFIVALLPRILGLGRFVTFDEANFWLKRSDTFMAALTSGDFAATAITVHPGVTTMWLGGVGLMLHRTLAAAGLLANDTFALRLALAQLPVALVHAAGVLLGYRLLRRLLQPTAAFLAGLLWASDPFVIGYSRILHVDALAGTFLTLSLLAACVYWHHRPHPATLALSAVCASLAILSKSPAAALLPVVSAMALAGLPDSRATRLAERVRQAAGPLLAWGSIALLTSVLVWPAILAAPVRVFDLLQLGVSAEGAQPHQLGNFFLGQPYAEVDPGLRYYPVVLALRATPWTLLGLLLLPLALPDLRPRTRRDVMVLAGFAILFTITMDLFPKKFDRYLVPAFPAIDILAAVGIIGLIDSILQLFTPRSPAPHSRPHLHRAARIAAHAHRPHLHRLTRTIAQAQSVTMAQARKPVYKHDCQESILSSGARLAAAALIGALALVNVAEWHPYEIGAFNQALGGAPAGATSFVVGWGEGLEQAAAWLNRQPDITGVTVAAARTEPLQAYMRPGAQAVAPPESGFAPQTGYAVVYLPDVQGGAPWPPFDQVFGQLQPAHEVMINGMTYAWIYQLPPPVSHRLATRFGAGLNLRGYTLQAAPQPGKALTIALSWATAAHPPADVALFVHLLGRDGTRYAQADPVLPVESWGPNRYFSSEIALALPADLAPGHYRIVIGVYDRATGQRMPLQPAATITRASDGPDALTLAEFDVPAP